MLYEGLCMFSNKPSFFASKRWERFVMFWIAMWVMIGYVTRNWYSMEISEVEIIAGTLLTGGIVNAMMIRKDQQANDKTPKPADAGGADN